MYFNRWDFNSEHASSVEHFDLNVPPQLAFNDLVWVSVYLSLCVWWKVCAGLCISVGVWLSAFMCLNLLVLLFYFILFFCTCAVFFSRNLISRCMGTILCACVYVHTCILPTHNLSLTKLWCLLWWKVEGQEEHAENSLCWKFSLLKAADCSEQLMFPILLFFLGCLPVDCILLVAKIAFQHPGLYSLKEISDHWGRSSFKCLLAKHSPHSLNNEYWIFSVNTKGLFSLSHFSFCLWQMYWFFMFCPSWYLLFTLIHTHTPYTHLVYYLFILYLPWYSQRI